VKADAQRAAKKGTHTYRGILACCWSEELGKNSKSAATNNVVVKRKNVEYVFITHCREGNIEAKNSGSGIP
jgi:hypothetical protein